MNNYNQSSSALKVVQQAKTDRKKPRQKHNPVEEQANIRKNIRAEAKTLRKLGYCLLVLCVIGSSLLFTINGYICHSLVNDVMFDVVGVDASTSVTVFAVLSIGGFIFAGICVFFALTIFGVAETLHIEAKKIQ